MINLFRTRASIDERSLDQARRLIEQALVLIDGTALDASVAAHLQDSLDRLCSALTERALLRAA